MPSFHHPPPHPPASSLYAGVKSMTSMTPLTDNSNDIQRPFLIVQSSPQTSSSSPLAQSTATQANVISSHFNLKEPPPLPTSGTLPPFPPPSPSISSTQTQPFHMGHPPPPTPPPQLNPMFQTMPPPQIPQQPPPMRPFQHNPNQP